MIMRTIAWYIVIIVITMVAYSCKQQDQHPLTAKTCLEEAESALTNDSIRLGETLLRKAIRLAETSEDWHTEYIAYQRLAEALSQSNPEEALRLMKRALTVYEQHPDDERNKVILLDYAGTYAAQVAFVNEESFDEALGFIRRAYDIAKKNEMTDLMCQTLTSLANIAWAKEDYRQAVDYAIQAAELPGTAELRPGILQVLARSYLSLNILDSAETVYRQIEPGEDVHLAYIVQSNLAKIALRRLGAKQVEDSVAEAFEQVEDIYYKALEQKDEYYQETLRQEMKNQQLEYHSQMYGRILLITIIASFIVILAIVMMVWYRMRAQLYLNDDYEDGASPDAVRKGRIDFTHTIKTRPKAPRRREAETPSLYGEYNDSQLGIYLEPLDEAYLVRIAGETGKTVYEKAVDAGSIMGLNIDISTYPKGRYTVTVENSRESYTGTFIAQATGISASLMNHEKVNNEIYNLQGQRLSTMQKGVNIVNRQKIYVK